MSYNDYDLGYDLGYDSETIISPTTNAPTQANGNESGVVYRMWEPGSVASGEPRTVADWVREISSGLPAAGGTRTEETEETGGAGDVYSVGGNPDAELGRTLGSPVPADMVFTPEEVGTPTSTSDIDSERSRRAMDSACESLHEMGWNDGAIAMFRDQYRGLSADQLTGTGESGSIMNPRGEDGTPVPEAERSDAIRGRMVREFQGRFADDIQSIYGNDSSGEPIVNRDDALAMANRLISSVGSVNSYNADTYGELYSRVESERAALGDGETYRDSPLYTEVVDREREDFTGGDSLRGALTAADRPYYNPRTASGREHLDHDSQLFVDWYRTRTPALRENPMSTEDAVSELSGMDATALGNHVEAFHDEVGRNPGRRGTPSEERDRVERLHDERGWIMSRMNPEERARFESEERGREHESEMETRREAFQIVTEDRAQANREALAEIEHGNRMGENMFNQAFQMLGQLINSSMETITATPRGILEATSAMVAVRPMSVGEVMGMVRGNQPTQYS